MVVFEDGLPKKSDYRHFKVATVAGNDDYAAMEEVLTRRLAALLDEERRPDGDGSDGTDGAPDTTGATRRRFAYPPQLLLIDGGLGQLHVATRVLDRLGLTDRIPVASLAKSFEEVYLPGLVGARAPAPPVRGPLPAAAAAGRGPPVRHLLPPDAAGQTHDGRGPRRGPGLGPKRRSRLVEQFGGLGELRKATRDELMGLSWLPAEVGAAVFEHLHTPMAPER